VEKKVGKNPTDRAKQGVKRSLATDKNGIPLACIIAGANINDFKLLEETLNEIPRSRSYPLSRRSMCLDKGYDYEVIRALLKKKRWKEHIRTRGEERREKQKKRGAPKRWVVERTHSWMNRFRGLLIRWCKKAENFQAQVDLVCAYITFGQSGLLG
jgi:putative transposase